MSLRFTSQLLIDNLPDEQLEDQFEVIMPELDIGGNVKYRPIVEEIEFGVRNFNSSTRRVRTGWVGVADDIERYHAANITMFCSTGMLTQQYLTAWRQLIYNEEGEYYNPLHVYKKNIKVMFFGSGMIRTNTKPKFSFILKGCFPMAQDNFRLQYTMEPKRLTIQARFNVDTVVYDTQEANDAAREEILANPASILGNITQGLSSDLNFDPTYTTYNTYGPLNNN